MPDARADLAELLAAVDPAALGERIRQARRARGLIQADLAGDEVSIGYVSRIESGQRRPEVGLLERIAERLSVPALVLVTGVADPALTEWQLALDHAELALRGGLPAEALARLDAIRTELVASGLPDLMRRGQLTRALALEAVGRLDDATLELEDLLAAAPYDDRRSVRAAVALSRCYRESGDLARAVDVGERHLDELRRLDLLGSDEAVQLVVTVAGAHFERGDHAHAARMCRRAIDQAERLGTPLAKASAYWNASLVENQRGSAAAAVELAGKALRLLETLEDNRNLARLRSELGWILLRTDPPAVEEAMEHLQAAERQLRWSSASPVDLGRNAVATARAELMSGEVEQAETRAGAVLEQFRTVAPLVAVEALTVLGEAAAWRGDTAAAAGRYREAVHEMSGMGSDRGAAQLWFELAAQLEALGLATDALHAYRSAAASTGLVSVRTTIGKPTL